MRSLLFALALSAVSSFGAFPVITQGAWVSGITRSTALFSWVTDINGTRRVKWGLSAGSLSNSTDDGPSLNSKIHSWFVTAMPANTLIYYQVCSTNAGDETCSATNTFYTLSQGAIPATPAPPAPVDTPITPTGTVRPVGPDCDDPTTGLIALWTASEWGDIVEIDPAITPRCANYYPFPAKTPDTNVPHRYILTRVKDAASHFTATGRVSPADKPNMARFIHNTPGPTMIGTANPSMDVTNDCFAGDLRWRQGQANAWAMYRCNNTTPRSITAIPSSGNLNITVPANGITVDGMGWVTGVTGPGASAVNGGWYLHVIAENTFQLQAYIGKGIQQATGAVRGGTIYLNRNQLEPVTEGDTLPDTCTYGDWWHKQASSGTEDEYNRTYYCVAPNEWIKYRLDPYNKATVIDLLTNKATHLMFDGLSFEPLPMKADLQLIEYKYNIASNAGGRQYGQFLTQSHENNHIYWDHILGVCPDPSPTGSMVRCQGFGNSLDGAHIQMTNSYISGLQVFNDSQDIYDGSAVGIVIQHGPGPHNFTNNYLACAGICFYYPDDTASTSRAGDLTFTRNYIETPDKYFDQSPNWLGAAFSNRMYWSQRHRLELKRGNRMLLDGNIFAGGWAWNNNGAAICLCTRGGVSGAQISEINDTEITTYGVILAADYSVEDLRSGDKIKISQVYGSGTCPADLDDGRVFTVANVIDSAHFTVAPGIGCVAFRGNIARVGNDTAYISDVSIKNNTIKDSPTGVYLIGHDNYIIPSNAMQRISITNNLFQNVDGLRVGLGSFSSYPANAPTGSIVVVVGGMEDLILSHNTSYNQREYAFLNSDTGGGASINSGLMLKANILYYLAGDYSISNSNTNGTAALNSAWRSGDAASWTAPYNLIIRAGGRTGVTSAFPALTHWFDSTAHPISELFNNPMGDLQLKAFYRYTDSCFGIPGDCTDDGQDVGVNMSALLEAQANSGGDSGTAGGERALESHQLKSLSAVH